MVWYGAGRTSLMVVFMQEHALHGQVLLVVGDEPVFPLGLEECLEAAGAQVAQASLQDSPRFIQQGHLSAVVLDCHPVSRERRALIRLLRQRGVPFLFYSEEPPAEVTTE